MYKILLGVIIPFLGTSLGAFLVFFLKDKISNKLNRLLLGFAAGVMFASSIWSLIIPAINQAEFMGKWLFIPPFCGICFETQNFPDSPNRPEFPSTILKPNQEYNSITEFHFEF